MIVIVVVINYGLSMAISGWYFGRKDAEYLPIYDIGFRFHLTPYLVHNMISILCIGIGLGQKAKL